MSDHAPSELLDAYDAFMRGGFIAQGGEAMARAVALASSFAAAAYEDASPASHAQHALARSFLLALVNPAHPDLDYLRGDPSTGKTVRDAMIALDGIAKARGKA